MDNKAHIIKNILFSAVVLLMSLPIIQSKLELFEIEPLDGAITKLEEPHFTISSWLNGSYQKKQQDYLNENFGFRDVFVRLHNDLDFRLYNEINAKNVILGKDNYLFEENYILTYKGLDFIGEQKIEKKVNKLVKLKDTLNAKGIDIIVILAPGKGSYYPEFIPDKYKPTVRSISNYEVYQRKLKEAKINLIDAHQWFRDMKKTSPYPLFPKTGIHWSAYGEFLVVDSLMSYISTLSTSYHMPKYIIDEIEVSSEMKKRDNDIEKGMNLLFDISTVNMAYPKYHLKSDSLTKSPRVLSVSDSFYWGIYNMGVARDIFNEGQFWFYNKKIFQEDRSPRMVRDVNIIEEVEKHDLILLIATDATLYKFAFGFIDKLFELYQLNEKSEVILSLQ